MQVCYQPICCENHRLSMDQKLTVSEKKKDVVADWVAQVWTRSEAATIEGGFEQASPEGRADREHTVSIMCNLGSGL